MWNGWTKKSERTNSTRLVQLALRGTRKKRKELKVKKWRWMVMLREITVMMKTLEKRIEKETSAERKMSEKKKVQEKEKW